jgi:hypothetical protein
VRNSPPSGRRADLLLQLFLVIGPTRRAHDDDAQLVVQVDARHLVVPAQHVLVEQEAEGQFFRIVAHRHHGDDFLIVEEQGQRPFDHDPRFDVAAVLIQPGHRFGQARVLGIGPDPILRHIVLLRLNMG